MDILGISDTQLKDAYDHCEQVTKNQARNFYYAFITLPMRKKRAIYTAYAFCRICDDAVDNNESIIEKKRLLNTIEDNLKSGINSDILTLQNDPIILATCAIIKEFDISEQYFFDVIDGVRMDIEFKSFATFEDVKDYCYKVASVIGLICITIFGYTNPKAKDYAIDFGLAMQLTNILRDIPDDLAENRCYLAFDEMDQFNYSINLLSGSLYNNDFINLMKFEVDRAKTYFESGSMLLPLVNPDSRICLKILSKIYSKILKKIEMSNYHIFNTNYRLNTFEKLSIMGFTWLRYKITKK
ncbi:MAG: squalene synthase [Chloroflexi bacterium]|nr:squalene synthase [Chloroflexota bacterium]